MTVTTVKVLNELGLHARPIAKLVKAVTEYGGAVRFEKGGKRYDAASLAELLVMNAKQDDELRIEIEGGDEKGMSLRMEQMFLNRFGERN
jgi:phosphocarrier protein